MARTKLSNCAFVELGYGQVEPNLLSAQRTGQIYAQLPAAANITVLENGQFAKYNYADGVVDFAGEGEWMLVYNEVKVYRDYQRDCDFAMVKDNYEARVYSPITGEVTPNTTGNVNWTSAVAAADPYEIDSTANPMQGGIFEGPALMFGYEEDGTTKKDVKTMVPRLFKTNVGDIFTTNTINVAEVAVGDVLAPGADGYLATAGDDATMKWQVVKVYTMPDGQKGAKIMRIA
jgi:hypothetical protein